MSITRAVSELVEPSTSKRKRGKGSGSYTHYTEEQRAKIGKYALENGNERTRRHFSSQLPNLKESTIRISFKVAYKRKLDEERKKSNPQPVTQIPTKPKGRPPILLDLDEKLIKFFKAVRVKGGVVNIHIVRVAAKALIESSPSSQHLRNFTMARSLVQSLYRRMGYSRRAGTTARPPGLYDEYRRDFLQDIDKKVKEYNIPPELVLNSDQTTSSYVSVGKSTMAARGSKTIAIKGMSEKRAITLNFVVTYSNEFLPMQVIYSGKTKASQHRDFNFPPGFFVTQNPKHWSNEEETRSFYRK